MGKIIFQITSCWVPPAEFQHTATFLVYIRIKYVKNTTTELIKRTKHFRSLTYKGISTKTATQIYKSICRPLLDYGNILMANSTPKTKQRNKLHYD